MAARNLQDKVSDLLNTAAGNSTILPDMPKVSNLDSLKKFGEIILNNPDYINEFSNMINRIAEVVVWNRAWRNPLEFLFKDGEYGDSIEEVFVNTAKLMGYDPYGDGADQWKRVPPDVRVAMHVMNVFFYTEQTVYDKGLKRAFISFEGFNSFFQGIITAMYNALSKGLFQAAKYVLARYIIDAGAAGQLIEEGAEPEEYTIAMKTATSPMSFLSSKYNAAGVDSFSTVDDLYLFVTPNFDARQDVEVLAYMFNVELGMMPYRKIVLDDLWNFRYDMLNEIFQGGVEQFTDDEIAKLKSVKAIMADKNLLLLYDMHHSSEVARNKLKLYENYFMHFWGIMTYSPFANCFVFAEGTPDDTVTSWKNPYGKTEITVGRDNRFFAIPATAYGVFTEQESVEPTVSGTGLVAITGHSGWYQAVNTRGATATITYAVPDNGKKETSEGAGDGMQPLVINVKVV